MCAGAAVVVVAGPEDAAGGPGPGPGGGLHHTVQFPQKGGGPGPPHLGGGPDLGPDQGLKRGRRLVDTQVLMSQPNAIIVCYILFMNF